MVQFTTSVLGLVTAILLLIAGIIGLIAKCVELIIKIRGPKPPTEIPILLRKLTSQGAFLVTVILFIVGLGMLIARLMSPTVVILYPSGSVEATAEGDSVWFSVSGKSSGVFSNKSLMLYVLVYSEPDWHVQRSAIVEGDGRWTLTQAWIGDASAPIRTGDQIRLIAIVSREKYIPDAKFPDYKQLDLVVASEMVSARVSTVRGR